MFNPIRPLTPSLILLVAILQSGCAPSRSAGPKLPGRGVTILKQVQGSHLSLSEPTVKLINSHHAFNALGIDQLNDLGANFVRHSVLLIAAGQKPTGGYWIQINSIQIHGEDLYFQGIANKPGRADKVAQALTYPYTAVLLPKIRAVRMHPEIESVVSADPK